MWRAEGTAGEPGSVAALTAVAALQDDSRRRLYEYIRSRRAPVTREEAADSIGISRKLAAFHLDRLVDVGLLQATVEVGEGRRRVGRRPKVYQPSGVDVLVAVPDRRPDLLATILVEAVAGTEAPGDGDGAAADGTASGARAAALRVARDHGVRMGRAERERVRPGRLGPERALRMAEAVLRGQGFEPGRDESGALRLRNCPFHPIVLRSPELVCPISHAFVEGLLDGLGAATLRADLAPRPGECCVEVRPA